MGNRTPQSIELGDRTFSISKLTLGALREHTEALDVVMGMRAGASLMPSKAQLAAIVEIVHAGIVCAAKDAGATPVAYEEFLAHCDRLDWDDGLKLLTEAIPIVMRKTGFAKLAEVAPPGEAAGPASST